MDKLNKNRILLIEDNHLNLRIMSRTLRNMDFDVIESSSGKDALKYAKDLKFFMIFICVFVPENIGYEATKKIREHSFLNKETPIIAVSSMNCSEMSEKLAEHGINDCISKPLIEDEVTNLFNKYNVSEDPLEYKVFNKDVFESFYSGDILKKEILTIFLDERESDASRINKAFKSKDKDKIYEALHYMKGSFTYMKADNILVLTQEMLDLLTNNALNDVMELEKTFTKKLDLLNDELIAYIKKYDKL